MRLHFSDSSQQGRFFRTLRLVHDDLISFAHAAAPYCAINLQADDTDLRARLNSHATFWNCVLASLQTTAIISLSRLHDKTKNKNHLLQLIRYLHKQSPECVRAASNLEAAIATQQPFIDRILRLRNDLFAHTSCDAPLIATFGFEGLKIEDFSAYWSAILQPLVECDAAMFGTAPHAPSFDPQLFHSIEQKTLIALQSGASNQT